MALKHSMVLKKIHTNSDLIYVSLWVELFWVKLLLEALIVPNEIEICSFKVDCKHQINWKSDFVCLLLWVQEICPFKMLLYSCMVSTKIAEIVNVFDSYLLKSS